MQSKMVQHSRLTLVSLLHEFGKVPPSRFPTRNSEDNCTGKRPQYALRMADIHLQYYVHREGSSCHLTLIDQRLYNIATTVDAYTS